MAEKILSVWATLLFERDVSHFVGDLVREGFLVEALGENNHLTEPGELATLCALMVTATDDFCAVHGLSDAAAAELCAWVMERVLQILDVIPARFYSIVVQHEGASEWEGPNVRLSDLKLPEPQPPVQNNPGMAIDRMEKEIGG